MTSALLLPDHRPMRAGIVVDSPNVEDIVNDPVTRDLQRLDGQVEITNTYAFACGGYADIYPGTLYSGLDPLDLEVWTGKTISGRGIAVRAVHVYSFPSPDSRTTTCIKVAFKVFRDVHYSVRTSVAQEKRSKASQ